MDHLFLSNIQGIEYITKGNTPAKTDENITQDWLSWYKNRDTTKPYFSFIWYGSVYGNDFPQEYTEKYFPTSGSYRYHDLVKKYGADAFIGTYKTAVNYLDDLANKIITVLQEDNALNNTIVIITSDHGQDFAENRQNFWGHGTNFTDGQIKVPFAIIHPKFNQQQIITKENSLTTHYDLVPTLMKNFLGITNDISDYSVGVDLLAKNTQRDCDFVTGNFKWCGIANSEYIINFHPSGNYYITDKQNQPLFNKKVNENILYLALKNMFKFSH
jgi:membrane-anchored protein YejM (alkaline phosphatase superfamily)